jgi:hypothetical protein
MAGFMPNPAQQMSGFEMGRMSGPFAGANSAVRQGLAQWHAEQAAAREQQNAMGLQMSKNENALAVQRLQNEGTASASGSLRPTAEHIAELGLYSDAAKVNYDENTGAGALLNLDWDPKAGQVIRKWSPFASPDQVKAKLSAMMDAEMKRKQAEAAAKSGRGVPTTVANSNAAPTPIAPFGQQQGSGAPAASSDEDLIAQINAMAEEVARRQQR